MHILFLFFYPDKVNSLPVKQQTRLWTVRSERYENKMNNLIAKFDVLVSLGSVQPLKSPTFTGHYLVRFVLLSLTFFFSGHPRQNTLSQLFKTALLVPLKLYTR